MIKRMGVLAFIFSVWISMVIPGILIAQEVPSPPCSGCGGVPTTPKPFMVIPPSPLVSPTIPNALEYDGTNLWLTGKNGTRGSVFSGNAPANFNNTVTFGSSGVLDFNTGSVINFADGSVWKSTGLVFGTGTNLSFPDGSAWDSSGLIFGTSGTETLPDGSKWSSGGLTNNTTISGGIISSSPSGNLLLNNRTLFFTASGTWTVPTGVTKILVSGVGGGGGGGSGGFCNGTGYFAGGGGGGGSGQPNLFTPENVTPGDTITITVGQGGGGGAGVTTSCNNGAAGGAGTNTVISDSTIWTITLNAGSGGDGGGASSTTITAGGFAGPGYPPGIMGQTGASNHHYSGLNEGYGGGTRCNFPYWIGATGGNSGCGGPGSDGDTTTLSTGSQSGNGGAPGIVIIQY